VSERKRATHYALMDSAFAADRKFVRLARKATIPIEYAAAVGVFWLLLADCRRAKSPDIDWDEYAEYEPQIELLREVGLLSESGFPTGPFEKWAPAYKSPFDATRGTKRDTGVRNGTRSDATSVQFSSIQGGGAGEGPAVQGVWNGGSTHDGRHGPACLACHPKAGVA
jgi:hypothetical protein